MKWNGNTAVIGGGLAGIAAADAAIRRGASVTLFEGTGVLGGRLASLFDTQIQKYLDIGQHLFFGCCTNLIAVNQSLGLDRFFKAYHSLPFAAADGKRWMMKPVRCLPKHLQFLPAVLQMPFIPFPQRLTTARLLNTFVNAKNLTGTVADFLTLHSVSPEAVTHVWEPMIFSVLSETLECSSAAAAQSVIRNVFLGSATIFVPSVPLRTIYNSSASAALQSKGVSLRLYSRVNRLRWEKTDGGQRITALELADGTEETFDRYILAVPFSYLWKILQESDLEDFNAALALDRFELGTITTAHLFLDRPLVPDALPMTMLTGGCGQFLCRPQLAPNAFGYHHTVVISASHRLLTETEISVSGKELLVSRITGQLRQTFGVPDLAVRYSRIVTNFEAVFSPNPLVFNNRPASATPFSNLTLAGDWTQTGYPSTMEGAAQSGIAALR
ncbi:MAG: hydroxysqualene dehydroxylase HpnE [Planctomycetaceae bacterium]|jgi:zeta-carotene desaturase|nr:hydroxysqualene dehydroxylase HpnE [Planctomycetaceae bacterium]